MVFDTETRATIATYSSHNKAVRTIGWSPDSQVGGYDKYTIHTIIKLTLGSSSGCTQVLTTI